MIPLNILRNYRKKLKVYTIWYSAKFVVSCPKFNSLTVLCMWPTGLSPPSWGF